MPCPRARQFLFTVCGRRRRLCSFLFAILSARKNKIGRIEKTGSGKRTRENQLNLSSGEKQRRQTPLFFPLRSPRKYSPRRWGRNKRFSAVNGFFAAADRRPAWGIIVDIFSLLIHKYARNSPKKFFFPIEPWEGTIVTFFLPRFPRQIQNKGNFSKQRAGRLKDERNQDVQA